MKEQVVSYEISMVIKNKGFDIKTECSYFDYEDVDFEFDDMGRLAEVVDSSKFGELDFTNSINIGRFGHSKIPVLMVITAQYLAPTQSLLQKWLREAHDIHVYVSYEFESYRSYVVVNNTV
jgi:hypothetical protein